MTMLGKILVLINFAFSVTALTVAAMLYINHIDWTEGTEKEPGKLRPVIERIKEKWAGITAAEPSWRDVHANLLEQERLRVADRVFYDGELRHALSGATAANPAREVVYNNGVIVPPYDPKTKQLRPQMRAASDPFNRPLASLDFYMKAEQEKVVAVTQEQLKLRELVDEDTRLATLLKPPEPAKGLRQRIEDEKVKIKLVDKELAIIRPLLVNTSVESELVLKRRQALETRIKELSACVHGSGR